MKCYLCDYIVLSTQNMSAKPGVVIPVCSKCASLARKDGWRDAQKSGHKWLALHAFKDEDIILSEGEP